MKMEKYTGIVALPVSASSAVGGSLGAYISYEYGIDPDSLLYVVNLLFALVGSIATIITCVIGWRYRCREDKRREIELNEKLQMFRQTCKKTWGNRRDEE